MLKRDCLVLTNNPLAAECLMDSCVIDYRPNCVSRDILIAARDAVYMGHTLYTHPLSGSVKPCEMPYKSVVISRLPHQFEAGQAEIIANAVMIFERVKEQNCILTEKILRDYQMLDYALVCSGMGINAAVSLCTKNE